MAGVETYYFGECTYYCARELAWVRGGWGNAGDWPAAAARDGFQLTLLPTVGAVVVYAAGDGYSAFGHCGIVRAVGVGDQFLVSEMNYVAWDEVDERWSGLYDVAAFILPPGVAPGSTVGGLGGGAADPGSQAAGDVQSSWAYFADYMNRRAWDEGTRFDQLDSSFGEIG